MRSRQDSLIVRTRRSAKACSLHRLWMRRHIGRAHQRPTAVMEATTWRTFAVESAGRTAPIEFFDTTGCGDVRLLNDDVIRAPFAVTLNEAQVDEARLFDDFARSGLFLELARGRCLASRSDALNDFRK